MSTSDVMGPIILKALGINMENCVRATITLQANEDVAVQAEYRIPVVLGEDRLPLQVFVERNLVVRDRIDPIVRLEGERLR